MRFDTKRLTLAMASAFALTLAASPLALANNPVAVDAGDFTAQRANIEKGLADGKTYAEISSADRSKVRESLDRMAAMLGGGKTPETLPADHHEIQAWYANEAVENSLKQLKQSDFEMIRVLDDLIQVLTQKGVIRVTDLPPAAQAKLMDRTQAREALGGLSQLIDEDEGGLI